jgi:hypothetical protein
MTRIFCIGFNKTGTSSLSGFFRGEDYIVAPQTPFECNLYSYISGNYETFEYMIENDFSGCVFFQDVPFSLPKIYEFLDKKFPNSKFILTIRNNSDEWYHSLVNYHKDFNDIHKNFIKITDYIHRNWIQTILTKCYGAPNHNPYDEESLKNTYEKHILDVESYFKNREDKLLTLNLSDELCVEKLEDFLGRKFINKKMPHLNKGLR